MSHEDNLNRDLFGNIVHYPEPPEAPKEPTLLEEIQQEWRDNQAMDARAEDNVRAHVPKISIVKEGQQYPEGKGGQLKLFHEHEWRKGYTPERQKQVQDAIAPMNVEFAPTANTLSLFAPAPSKEETYVPGEVERLLVDHLARSTVPLEDIKKMANSGMSVTANAPIPPAAAGAFTHEDIPSHGMKRGIHFALKPPLNAIKRANPDMDTHGIHKTMMGNAVTHEMGHLLDFINNPTEYDSNPRVNYIVNGVSLPAVPRDEGIAEGYRISHHRATRAMKKAAPEALGMYHASNFETWPDSNEFRKTRDAETAAQDERAEKQ